MSRRTLLLTCALFVAALGAIVVMSSLFTSDTPDLADGGVPAASEPIYSMDRLVPEDRDWEPTLAPPDPLSDRIEDRVRAFADATIAYHAPKTMRFGETHQVRLVLAPETSGIDPGDLLGPDLEGQIVTAEIDHGLRMQATLAGGSDFEIDPAGPQAQTILPDRAASWVWAVRPIRFGENKILTLRLDAILRQDGQDMPPIHVETYTGEIVIDVGLWDRTVAFAEKARPVHALAAGLGASLVGVAGWLWRRRRRDDAPTSKSNSAKQSADEA